MRTKEWRKKVKRNWKKEGGSISYKMLKKASEDPIGAVITSEGEIKTGPSEIVEEIANSWTQLFNKNEKADAKKIIARYGRYIKKTDMKMRELDGSHYKEEFKRMKTKRATAADGWAVQELRDLPMSLLSMGARLMAEAEEEKGRWPDVLVLGITSCIRKGAEADEATRKDPSEVVAAQGEETRPITNMSPWVAAYENLRYGDAEKMREANMTEDMHGARKHHEVFGVSFPLALQIEEAGLANIDIAGISIDKRKFFDLLEYDVIEELLKAAGAPEKYTRAQRKLYTQLKVRYKVGDAVSSEKTRTNGYIQGLSGSITAASLIMGIWDKMIKEEVNGVETGGFIDDASIRSNGPACEDQLLEAWNKTKEFDRLSGMKTNKKKTKACANSETLEKQSPEGFSKTVTTKSQVLRI